MSKLFCYTFKRSVLNLYIKRFLSSNCKQLTEKMNEQDLLNKAKQIVPALTSDKHKGQAGRIGIIGGSHEYTGAPYFSAISALKVGADLVHVFCVKDAANVIKSYSPDLIVHPILDSINVAKEIEPWIDRLHAVVLGPGLGREQDILRNATIIVELLKAKQKPLIIDADGLFLVTQHPQLIKDYPNLILTPNKIEYERLMKIVQNMSSDSLLFLNEGATIVCKGAADEIFNKKMNVKCTTIGSNRRCGGQGDILSGAIATFTAWSLNSESNKEERDVRTIVACFGACHLVRKTSNYSYQTFGRSMVANDMIQNLGKVFKDLFEN